MTDIRVIRRLMAPLAALLALASAGCDAGDSDGAPVEAEAVTSPVPEVNPQGFFRAVADEGE